MSSNLIKFSSHLNRLLNATYLYQLSYKKGVVMDAHACTVIHFRLFFSPVGKAQGDAIVTL